MARRIALTGFVLLVLPPEQDTMRLVFAQVVTLVSLCAVSLIAPYKRPDNNTLAFVAQLMLLFVLNLAMCIKLYKDIEMSGDTNGASTANAIMGFYDPFSFSLAVFCANVLMALLALGFMIRQGRVFVKRRRQQMRNSISGLTFFKHPMNLVSLARFASPARLTTHEEMRDSGGLTVFDVWEDAVSFANQKTIVFFSHQWLGWTQPDPNNAHFPVMLQAVEKLCSRFGHASEDVYIWIDCA